MNLIYTLMIAFASNGAPATVTESNVVFEDMASCNAAAAEVVASYEGDTKSRVGAFCVPMMNDQ